jgi:hypothetical protein
MRSATPPTVAGMRPITLICALAATLQLSCSTASAAAWLWPVRGPVLTPYRNGGDPYAAGHHRGIDIGAPVGSRVVAAVGGTISFAGTVGSSGLTVSERTSDGRFDLSYLHLSTIAVHRGDVVGSGEAVGAVGVSGRRSTAAPHLHFGVRDAGSRSAYRDPLDFLSPPPADRAPRPAPKPVPVAHPAVPSPVRAHRRAPRHVRIPRPAWAPRGVGAPLPIRVPLPHGRPAAHSHDAARAKPSVRPAPQALRGPAGAAPAAPRHPTMPHGATPKSSAPHGGINVGWLVACVGLIAAATALGQPDATRKLARRSRTRLSGLVRPASRGG